MTTSTVLRLAAPLSVSVALAAPALAQEPFTLTSPSIKDGGSLPANFKCIRDGGQGPSPPLAWANVPDGTQSFAVIMYHYPRGTMGWDHAPSHYWLLWNIPATTVSLDRGNTASVGDEGADKDMKHTDYTPPCAPPGPTHDYTIILYALNAPLDSLPSRDAPDVDWERMMRAMNGLVLASSRLTFSN